MIPPSVETWIETARRHAEIVRLQVVRCSRRYQYRIVIVSFVIPLNRRSRDAGLGLKADHPNVLKRKPRRRKDRK